jgi:poly-gamma-glutamate synthesis protein (capsule biosynthesis protein)
MGWGTRGLLDTVTALDAAGLPHFGAGADLAAARRPWIVTRAGTRIAFLGMDGVTANLDRPDFDLDQGTIGAAWGATDDGPGTSPYEEAVLAADVAATVATGAVVIPYLHAGTEYVGVPPAWVRAGARAAIAAGAAAVVTNHPHVIQGLEIYAGRPIVYSPGNFIFDQMEAWELRTGAILELGLQGNRVVRVRLHGVVIEDFHQPRPMDAGEQASLTERFWANTDRLAAQR